MRWKKSASEMYLQRFLLDFISVSVAYKNNLSIFEMHKLTAVVEKTSRARQTKAIIVKICGFVHDCQ